ncbi:MAG: ATP-binding protein [Bacteroidetes bacterium]|jgi:PAS domain S-box-containing protein|nr:ATP-binding protein [Bacteroidota bacterium]
MALELNIFSLSLLLPVIVCTLLGIQAMKPRYAAGGKLFALLMLLVAAWSLSYAMELASTTYEGMLFWLKVEYLFIPFVSLVLFLVVQQYAGLEFNLRTNHLLYLLPIPVVTSFLSVTNDFHHLYYKAVSIDNSGAIPLLSLEVALWYYVHVFYSYLLIIAASLVLLRKLYFQRSLFRNQLAYMLIAVLFPAVFLSLYLTRSFPYDNIDPTPFAFTFSGLAMSVSILRYRMLDLMPIAREHVFTSMADGLVVVDRIQRIVDANPESMKIFGWNKIPFGQDVSDVWKMHPELLLMLKNRDTESIELEIEKQGSQIYYLVSNSIIRNHKADVVGVLLVIHDITIRQVMQKAIRLNEEKLQRMNAEKDKLFAVIAHDLRGPLGAFAGLTEMIMQQTDELSNEEMKELTSSMHQSASALHSLLENLLYWSRVQRDDVKIEPSKVDVVLLFDEVQALFQHAIDAKNLAVRKSFNAAPFAIADKQMLLTVLRNLLSNAIKFTHAGGRISISTYIKDPASLHIQVADSGIGMDDEILNQLFSFEKTGRLGTEGEPSSGLGLILSREFVERMGGKLMVSSVPGQGSEFTIVLPLG